MPRPRKSLDQKKAEGTLRARDKKEVAARADIALEPLRSIDPPAFLPASLIPTWREIAADLCKMGAAFPSDRVLLEQAFRCLCNTMTMQNQLTMLLEATERNKQMAEQLMDACEGKPDKHGALLIAELATGCASEIKGISSSMIAQESAYERILGKFGITPSERARLLTSLPRPPKDDKKKGALDYVRGKA
jgi:phage terminase small subunit